ncbi:hypothetical protein E8L99_02520 [Phreatobacter aquaticus]|uniref:Uncharacterized protein n=1 Tax=Phreatobacter aquaticus TaxID=2570229 RepID=A0A4D7QH75_9HYPH|nr:hypothetical protein [Phreatobacter aquaticus]QCK84737.1 hypothetical protein E8L99_02520 [Phreatobacter aquaticus]
MTKTLTQSLLALAVTALVSAGPALAEGGIDNGFAGTPERDISLQASPREFRGPHARPQAFTTIQAPAAQSQLSQRDRSDLDLLRNN